MDLENMMERLMAVAAADAAAIPAEDTEFGKIDIDDELAEILADWN